MMRTISTTAAFIVILGAAMLGPFPVSLAQNQTAAAPVDPAVLSAGEALFTHNCAQCHQATGLGSPPTFPALAGNEHLTDLGLIAGNIHNGKNSMPPFAQLSNDDIAALATYIRNSWGNSFGGVTADDVAAALAGESSNQAATQPAAPAGGGKTIWDGVFTKEQAARGEPIVSGTCAKCHGRVLNGAGEADQPPSPAIARVGFLTRWDGRTVATLFDYIKSTMPKDNPGQLTDQQYADVIADMLSVSKVPAGDTELPADPTALANIVIKAKPAN